MDTQLTASVATFRVFSSSHRAASAPGGPLSSGTPPSREDRMAATVVTEGPLILSRLASNEINYLQVNNFTRAVMPRSKIWRVSHNELVIPASFTNYWLITLNGPSQYIARLDHVLRGLCKYEVSSSDGEIEIPDDVLTGFPDMVAAPPKRNQDSNLAMNARRTISQGSFRDRLNEGISNDPPKPNKIPPRSAPASDMTGLASPDSSNGSINEDSAVQYPVPHTPRTPDLRSVVSEQPHNILVTPPATPPTQPANTLQQDPTNEIPSASVLPITKPLPSPTRIEPPISQSNDVTQTTPGPVRGERLELAAIDQNLEANHTKPMEVTPKTPKASSIESPPTDERPTTNHAPSLAPKHQQPLEARFEPRFSHPLIPSSHVSRYYPTNSPSHPAALRPRISLQRRELTTIGPSSLHQEVTTVGGYIGLKAVKGILRRT